MIDSLYNGISGLNIYQKALNSESNNISNVNTIAFKSDNISFSDMLYQNGYGKGSNVASISKNFTQGNMKTTSNSYDTAILGDGYFTVQNDLGSTFYTRAGNFKIGVDGMLRTANDLKVMGIATQTPLTTASNTNNIVFDDNFTNFLASKSIESNSEIKTINTKATNYQSSAQTSGVSGANYKTATAKISDIELLSTEYRNKLDLYASNVTAGTNSISQISQTTFDTKSIDNKSDNISIYIDGVKYNQMFDTNNSTTLNKLSDQISSIKGLTSSVDTTTGILTIKSLVPGKIVLIDNAKINNSNMDTQITKKAESGSGLASVNSTRNALKLAVENAGGEFLEITNSISLEDQKSLKLSQIQLRLDTLNVSDSPFGEFISKDGVLYIKQGENKIVVGKLITSNFSDNLELDPQGDNLYAKTKLSGEPIFIDNINKIKSKTLELSNSDLSKGLVNLMVYQRSFEANSKTITTSDDLLRTAIELKK